MSKTTPQSDSSTWDGSQTRHPEDDAPEAVFSGALVNLKNVATHKSVALTVEVPEEYAAALVAAFGWPTRVRPVPVAIARLAGDVVQERPKEKKKEHWAEMSPSKQAAILCQDPDFQDWIGAVGEEDSAKLVRGKCGVASRSDIVPGTPASAVWRRLMIEYGAWLRAEKGEA
jgi:hypothetical protein